MAGVPFDRRDRPIAPRLGQDRQAGTIEHQRREHDRRDADLDAAPAAVVEVGSSQRRRDSGEVAFEAMRLVVRPVEGGMDRPRSAVVGPVTDRARLDDLESAAADLDDRSRPRRHPSVRSEPIDAEWRPSGDLEHRHARREADVDDGVMRLERGVVDADVDGAAPDPLAPGTEQVLSTGVGAGGAPERHRWFHAPGKVVHRTIRNHEVSTYENRR